MGHAIKQSAIPIIGLLLTVLGGVAGYAIHIGGEEQQIKINTSRLDVLEADQRRQDAEIRILVGKVFDTNAKVTMLTSYFGLEKKGK